MLLRLMVLALVGLGSLGGLRAEEPSAEEFPYTAYIKTDDVNVRSGPGDNYYPVLRLQHSERVEVYRHDPGGWCAIRPPQGSFCWVSAEFLRQTEGNLAEVVGDNVAVRVGSRFNEIRDVIQVRLEQGEVVEILDNRKSSYGAGGRMWYKIAPPAGEFRWVSSKFIQRELSSAKKREGGPETDQLLARVAAGGARFTKGDKASPTSKSSTSGDREWTAPGASRKTAKRDDSAKAADDKPVATPDGTAKNSSGLPDDLFAALDQLDLELSAIVVQDSAKWNFDRISGEAEGLLAKAETPTDRGHARLLLNKIAKFEEIHQRQAEASNPQLAKEKLRSEGLLGYGRRESGHVSAEDRRYDGVGKLTEVVSHKPGEPHFALVDDSGEVRYYVTPAPGVSLRTYVGRQIGVNGTLGYLPEAGAKHVFAQRVMEVDGNTRLR